MFHFTVAEAWRWIIFLGCHKGGRYTTLAVFSSDGRGGNGRLMPGIIACFSQRAHETLHLCDTLLFRAGALRRLRRDRHCRSRRRLGFEDISKLADGGFEPFGNLTQIIKAYAPDPVFNS